MPSDATKRKNRPENPLDLYEERMEELYIREDLPLRRVKEMIDAESGQNIPLSRYRAKVEDRGWKKYFEAGATKALAIILKRRAQANKKSKVFRGGEQLPEDKVTQIITRSRPTTLEMMESPEIPRGFSVRTPSPEPTQNLTNCQGPNTWDVASLRCVSREIDDDENLLSDMPWLELEWALDQLSLDPQHQDKLAKISIAPELLKDPENTLVSHPLSTAGVWNAVPLNLDGIHSLGPSFFTNHPYVLATMKSLLPPSFIHRQLVGNSLIGYDTKMANSFTRQQLLFSIANNFAGLNGFPIWQPFKLLEFINTDTIRILFRLTQGPTARSIIQGLFKAAIESGAYTIVDAILSMSKEAAWPRIDVDEEKLFMSGEFYTPIECASRLRHHETVKVLLEYGADVNKTHDRLDDCNGALDCALGWSSARRIDIELFQLLSDKTNVISSKIISQLICNEEEDHLCYLLRKHVKKCVWDGPLEDPLRCLFHALSEERALGLMAALVGIKGKLPLLNLVAVSGYEKLFKCLRLEYRLCPNHDTLCSAVKGGSAQLVQALLSEGASIRSNWDRSCRFSCHDCAEYLRRTPLSVAIANKNEELIDLLRNEGAFASLDSPELCRLAWNAAVEASDLGILKEIFLVHSRALGPINLGSALKVVSRLRDYQFAKDLINRGADVVNSLVPAIQNKQEELIELLLDSGACVEHDSDPRLDNEDPLEAAVNWGNYSVIRRLLAEGPNPNYKALHAAVSKGDEKLIEMFLDAGANVNDGALKAAAKVGNVGLASYLLTKGADPDGHEALETAFRTNRALFETILIAHNQRYNHRKRGFGSEVLCLAIESNDTALIKHLLDHNADPHGFVSKDHQSITPFGYAIAMDKSISFAIVREFLQAGCSPACVVSYVGIAVQNQKIYEVRHPNDSGPYPRATAFLAAIATRNINLVRHLVKIDSKIVHAAARGAIKRTALQRAAEIGDLAMVEFICGLGADVNEPPNRISGATALQLAAVGGFLGIVCYLIKKGANVNAPGALINGITALVGAASQGRIDVVSAVLKASKKRGGVDKAQLKKAIWIANHRGHYPTRDYLQQWHLSLAEPPPEAPMDMEEYINYSPSGED
ncbi:hypothetical protein NUW58_g3171 [Xylaria curta]|uniref:Uncharacterized protein n=1 Tax=Xylaria curta TaxID=42375 RepID=A0ACC1PDH5_9PEZI|nr:hypothetical protein NUW58_g3171 [Xylaria curta]